MKLSVCLAGFNSRFVGDAITSIRRQTYRDWELLVVGQGDDTALRRAALAAAEGDPRVRYEHIDLPGTSRARNAAFQRGYGDVFVVIDDDCAASPDWLSTIASCFANDTELGLVGGAVVAPPPPQHWPRRCPEVRPSFALYHPGPQGGGPPRGWDWIGCNVAIRREILDAVGGLDEELGPGTTFPACEDTDFKLRLEALGIRMQTRPDAVVIHANGWRTGFRSLLQHQRNYARGNGAMAGKLTMQGDPRGIQWLAAMRRLALSRPWSLPVGLRRYLIFRSAYMECMRQFTLDERGLLTPRRQ